MTDDRGAVLQRKHLFADEAGDFDFRRHSKASKYFIVCVVSMDDCAVGNELLRLRRDLVWEGLPVREYFHASEDKQAVRDRVFELIKKFEFRIFAQILEKSKAADQIRETNHRFYQHAWFYLFKFAMPKVLSRDDQVLVTAASIGTKKTQAVFTSAVNDVLLQTIRLPDGRYRSFFCQAQADPCLQVADYCTWAIQRKWEMNDDRSYKIIKPKIHYEYDLWQRGTTHHY